MEKLSKYIPKILAGGAVFALLIFVLIGVDYYQKTQQTDGLSDSELLKTAKEDILDYEIRPVSGTTGSENGGASEGVVVYHYVSDKIVPAENYRGLKEDLSRRTASAQSFLKSVKKNASGQLEKEYVGKFYSADNWQKKGDKWFQIETATTTESAFLRQTKPTLAQQVKGLFGQPAFAAVNTTFSGAGDGHAFADNTDHDYDWDYLHNRTSADAADSVSATMWVGTENITGEYNLGRVFLPFNTSAISSDAHIVSANMSVMTFLNSQAPSVCANCNVNVVQTTQASASAIVVNDYDNCGSVHSAIVGATAKVNADFVAGSRTTFTLNDSGLGWIAKNGSVSSCGIVSGVTCLGLRTGYDLADVVTSYIAKMSITLYSSETNGTTNDPYLEITYVVPDLVSIDGGTVNMDGGTMIID